MVNQPAFPAQQDIQALHRARLRIVNHRTATVCQIRGLLLDRGITIGAAVSRVRRDVPLILEDAENGLSVRMRRTIAELYDLFNDLGRRISFFDKEIDAVFRQSEACQRIAKVKGIGPKTATAVVAAIGKGTEFKNGRHFAAWLGLVPRQHSSGDRLNLHDRNLLFILAFVAVQLLRRLCADYPFGHRYF